MNGLFYFYPVTFIFLKSVFFISLILISAQSFAQHSFTKHHYFNKRHRSRLVMDKKYNQIDDSDFMSYEVLAGNTNSWNGDVYNLNPSIQFVCSYDNNKNFEIGSFGNLVTSSIWASDANGIDLFASYRFTPKFSITADVYHYAGSKYFLQNDLGYSASFYQMYSCRFEYDLTDKQSYFLGYSILNDKEELQQSVMAEFDYDFNKHFTAVIGYTSESKIFQWQTSDLNLGVSYNMFLLKKSKVPLKCSTTLFPLTPFFNKGISPVTILISADF